MYVARYLKVWFRKICLLTKQFCHAIEKENEKKLGSVIRGVVVDDRRT